MNCAREIITFVSYKMLVSWATREQEPLLWWFLYEMDSFFIWHFPFTVLLSVLVKWTTVYCKYSTAITIAWCVVIRPGQQIWSPGVRWSIVRTCVTGGSSEGAVGDTGKNWLPQWYIQACRQKRLSIGERKQRGSHSRKHWMHVKPTTLSMSSSGKT